MSKCEACATWTVEAELEGFAAPTCSECSAAKDAEIERLRVGQTELLDALTDWLSFFKFDSVHEITGREEWDPKYLRVLQARRALTESSTERREK